MNTLSTVLAGVVIAALCVIFLSVTVVVVHALWQLL